MRCQSLPYCDHENQVRAATEDRQQAADKDEADAEGRENAVAFNQSAYAEVSRFDVAADMAGFPDEYAIAGLTGASNIAFYRAFNTDVSGIGNITANANICAE